MLRLLKEQKKRVPEDVRVMSLTGHSIGALLETFRLKRVVPLQVDDADHRRLHPFDGLGNIRRYIDADQFFFRKGVFRGFPTGSDREEAGPR